ncbi:MAG TPA: hypothetical protein VHS80_05555 [Chthoniobacterales bacterium]|jgi:hypothetical protein|nr:hypothetical protein [Chthoniobacterales bacterium]
MGLLVGAMPFALDVVVAVGAMKRLRPYPHDAVVEYVEDVQTGKITTGMPGAAALNEPEQGFTVMN